MSSAFLDCVPALARTFIACICFVIAPLHVSANDIITVETSGQAVATGAASDAHLERRALQEALYQAALKGGAQVSGYSAISQSVLRSDVLVVRPESRILDYTVLSSETSSKRSVVKVRAVVGKLDDAKTCQRRAQLSVVVHKPSMALAQAVPAWVPNMRPYIENAVTEALDNTNGVSTISPNVTPRQTSLAAEFSYTALTQGVAEAPDITPIAERHALHLRTSVEIGSPNLSNSEEWLAVKVTVALENNPFDTNTLHATHEHQLILKKRGPLSSLLKPLGDIRQTAPKTIAKITTQLVADLVDKRACQTLAGQMTVRGGKLTIPFGRLDGLSTYHLAYTDGRDTAYEILEITSIADHEATLRPLDSATNAKDLAGKSVQFMELKR